MPETPIPNHGMPVLPTGSLPPSGGIRIPWLAIAQAVCIVVLVVWASLQFRNFDYGEATSPSEKSLVMLEEQVKKLKERYTNWRYGGGLSERRLYLLIDDVSELQGKVKRLRSDSTIPQERFVYVEAVLNSLESQLGDDKKLFQYDPIYEEKVREWTRPDPRPPWRQPAKGSWQAEVEEALRRQRVSEIGSGERSSEQDLNRLKIDLGIVEKENLEGHLDFIGEVFDNQIQDFQIDYNAPFFPHPWNDAIERLDEIKNYLNKWQPNLYEKARKGELLKECQLWERVKQEILAYEREEAKQIGRSSKAQRHLKSAASLASQAKEIRWPRPSK